VPRELADIFERSVLPDLLENLDRSSMLVATLKVFGKGESDVAQLLEGLGSDLPEEAELTVQYRATFPEIHVRLVLTGITGPGAEELLDAVAEEAEKRLSKYVFATGGAVVPTTFAERVVQDLERAGLSLAAAEGCTGGELARLITSVPDAGEVYRGSLVAPRSTLRSELIEDAPDDGGDDEISDRLAQAYAVGIRDRFGADLGLSTVGTAEGAGDCEAGTMVVGLASAEGSSSRRFVFPVDRERFRRLAAYVALALLRRALQPPSA
jgi:nicotinamide-nucleotide amidase